MTFSLDTISMLLDRHSAAETVDDKRTQAAVAMILRQGANGLELLFIQRSHCENDPWSGNIAFPGGKVQEGETLRQAAERETWEEIGLDLSEALFLGPMPEVMGTTLPVRVSCFVYWLPISGVRLEPNQEVYETFWADLDDLVLPDHQLVTTVSFGGEAFETPAIQLPWPGSPVLWGLTYRLAMHFIEISRSH